MITNEQMITPLRANSNKSPAAIRVAIECYGKWKGRKFLGTLCFIADLTDHLFTGIVICRPDLFGMAKIIELPGGERAWFVRMAVGPLTRLLDCLPCRLPKICFCRRNDGRVREYSLERLRVLAREMEG